MLTLQGRPRRRSGGAYPPIDDFRARPSEPLAVPEVHQSRQATGCHPAAAGAAGPASGSGDLTLRNLYSITTNQAAITALFRVVKRYVGNLAPMPGVFPDYNAPIVRTGAKGRDSLRRAGGCPRRRKL
jgi:hypothetical protein